MRAIYKTSMISDGADRATQERFEIRGNTRAFTFFDLQKGESEEELIQKAAEAGVKVYGVSSYFIHRSMITGQPR